MNSFLSFYRVFLVECLKFSVFSILTSSNNEFYTSFLIWIPCIYISCLTDVALTFSTMLKKNGESGHSSLMPDLKEKNFELFTVDYVVSCGSNIMAFIMLRNISSIPHLLRGFILSRY